jgi:hypothetical protein
MALANGMWIGNVPHELSVLTLPERVLIARYFPAAYIVKLYPLKKGSKTWPANTMNKGIRGNVSTYRLNTEDISGLIHPFVMPPPACILSATIGVTFVGPKDVPEKTMPHFLTVRRKRVAAALQWLKQHNPLYEKVVVSEERLQELPEDGVPDEILNVTKYSADVTLLEMESAGYVPVDDDMDVEQGPYDYGVGSSGALNSTAACMSCCNTLLIIGVLPVDMEVDEDITDSVQPAVVPIQANGVIDASATDLSDRNVFAHAVTNTVGTNSFLVRRGSDFVNEYPRVDPNSDQRCKGDYDNPNHLLGAFPVLFPYGMGGFEVDRLKTVTYEAHAKWCLAYDDGRFRKDLHFVFHVFGVLQKRKVCSTATLQIKRETFKKNQSAIQAITANDLLQAGIEESGKIPYSHPGVRALRKHLSAVRSKIAGTDESRTSMRSQIWGTSLLLNPPSLWITINPSDTNDPIAQVMTGANIDLDKFDKLLGPNAHSRSVAIAADPFAAAKFFHYTVKTVIEELWGVKSTTMGIRRKEGVLGKVSAYIGAVETQGRGTLHLHIVVWLEGAPTSAVMREALKSDTFRAKVCRYIDANIKADLDGASTSVIASMPKQKAVSYSRPEDPRHENYDIRQKTAERNLAKAVQLHTCAANTCLVVKSGRLQCKRRAPFELSSCSWINEGGQWGTRRVAPFLNNWSPSILQTVRSNNDIKLITNGADTNDITFYITNYATKKRHNSSNTSALLAKRLAFHRKQEKNTTDQETLNRRLIQRCANTLSREHEFAAVEVISYLMGWGDRYLSHHYTRIYWDAVVSALKRQHPELRAKRWGFLFTCWDITKQRLDTSM